MSETSDEKILKDLLKRVPAERFVESDAPGKHTDSERMVALASLEGGVIPPELQGDWEHANSCRRCFAELAETREMLQFSESEEALSLIDTEREEAPVWRQDPARPNALLLRLDIVADSVKRALTFPSLPAMTTRAFPPNQPLSPALVYRGDDDKPVVHTFDLSLPDLNGALRITASLVGDTLSVRVMPVFPDKKPSEQVGEFWVWRKKAEREDINLTEKAVNEVYFVPQNLISSDAIDFLCAERTFRIELGFLSQVIGADEG